jgi:predicted CoA-binding protein
MTELGSSERREFWTRPGTFGIVGSFETDKKLSSLLLEQARVSGVDAVPVNDQISEAAGVAAVDDPGAIPSLAGIVCVRLDPYATQAVERAAELGVPVWLSQGTVSDEARATAERTGADLIAGTCPLMYMGELGSYHTIHRFFAKLFGQY